MTCLRHRTYSHYYYRRQNVIGIPRHRDPLRRLMNRYYYDVGAYYLLMTVGIIFVRRTGCYDGHLSSESILFGDSIGRSLKSILEFE